MDASRIAIGLLITGTKLCLVYRHREAVHILEKAKEIAEIIEGHTAKQLEGHINLNLALAHNNLNDYHKAMQSANRALELKNELQDIDTTYESNCYLQIGIAYKGLFQYSKAIKYIEKALTQKNEVVKLDDKAGKSECYNNLALLYVNLFDFQKGLKYLEKAKVIAEEIKDSYYRSSCYSNFSSIFSLSACETGLGKLIQGDELIGLTRSLLYKGAQSLIVSLWEVYGDSTARLMKEFYSSLKNGENKATSLRRAQMKIMDIEQYRHPAFWAPFVLIGNWK
jgi:tetratricopeptide (TPR) repeat protein